MRVTIILLAATFVLAACQPLTIQRYAISADNNQAIKAIGATGIGIKVFTSDADFDFHCRAVGAIQASDNVSYTQYIQKAFEDELKIAGAYASASPRVTLGGRVNVLDFSSNVNVTRGYWKIGITLDSSNGKSLTVNEIYEFDSGVEPISACRNTADAYSRAVQNLVGKAFKHPSFADLVLVGSPEPRPNPSTEPTSTGGAPSRSTPWNWSIGR